MYSIYDVLVPIIGNEIKIPENSICKQIIDELIEKENIDETELAKAQKYIIFNNKNKENFF